jgi:hypothetical protein
MSASASALDTLSLSAKAMSSACAAHTASSAALQARPQLLLACFHFTSTPLSLPFLTYLLPLFPFLFLSVIIKIIIMASNCCWLRLQRLAGARARGRDPRTVSTQGCITSDH